MFAGSDMAFVFGYANDVLQSIIVIFGAAVVLYNIPRFRRGTVQRSFSALIGLVVLGILQILDRALVPG